MSEQTLWRVADYSSLDNFPYMVCKEDGPAVAKVMFAADARLIIAAPDLLATLRELVEAVGGCAEALSWARWQYDAGLAAIAKAEGAPAGREPTDADYWDAIYDRGQR